MKTIRITLEQHPDKNDVSDGDAMRKHGDIITVSDEIANLLIAKNFAEPMDGTSVIEAKRLNEVAQEERRIAANKLAAEARMAVHDRLPAEVRQAVHDGGDEVTETYLDNQRGPITELDIETMEPVKKKRGRPAKERH